jgi:hypothetical protein
MSSTIPSKPVDSGPAPAWPNYPLYIGVKDALHRLPESFRSPLHIHGVLATDLFAFNSSLSAIRRRATRFRIAQRSARSRSANRSRVMCTIRWSESLACLWI